MFWPFLSRKVKDRFGFKTDQNGIYARYLREQGRWDGHLERCKAQITESVKRTKAKSVWILGSGWLLDVPMEFLLHNCTELVLVDLVHPPQILHKYRNQTNLRFVTADVTGGVVEQLESFVAQHKRIEGDFPTDFLLDLPAFFGLDASTPPDLVVSLNLLNQLDGIPGEFLRTKLRCEESQLLPLRRYIQAAHLKVLQACTSLLICDCDEYLWQNDEWRFNKSLIHIHLPKKLQLQEWFWDFDQSGAYYQGEKVRFLVKSFSFDGDAPV